MLPSILPFTTTGLMSSGAGGDAYDGGTPGSDEYDGGTPVGDMYDGGMAIIELYEGGTPGADMADGTFEDDGLPDMTGDMCCPLLYIGF
jgi:hypothetical protein